MQCSWKTIPNPWKDAANHWLVSNQSEYVLTADKEIIYNFNRNNKDRDDIKIQLSVPPSPFQGIPDAKIWILALNPGFNSADECLIKNPEIREAWIKGGLLFEKQNGGFHNFVLNPIFKEKKHPAYDWFYKQIYGSNRFSFDLKKVDSLFFLLQAIPYSSSRGGFPWGICLRQHWYNRHLIDWGIQHGKVFIITRAVSYWLSLMDPAIVSDYPERFFVTASTRNIVISTNNLIQLKYMFDPEKDLNKAKNQAADMIQSYL